VIHPVPPGTRDVLPDEMRELRTLTLRLSEAFERAGYGEVSTPAIEYEHVLRRGDPNAAGAGFRLFDETGQILALRSDPTIPIARLVANRYEAVDGPLRFTYFENAYRAVSRGSGQAREFLQGGVELIGVPGAEGDAEVIALVVEALSGAGLRRHRIGLGDATLYRDLLAVSDVPEDEREPLLELVRRRDFAGLEARVAGLAAGP
jgi:ATP phosphoribosyltransferase regulatory subunit